MQKIVVSLITYLFLHAAAASQEGVLPFSEFHIKSDGIGESGVIVVNGKKDKNNNFVSLSIKAFGKTIAIPSVILKQIPSKRQNGIQLSYEAGYSNLGGKTVYLQFQVGFTTGVREIFIISTSENGNVKIIKK